MDRFSASSTKLLDPEKAASALAGEVEARFGGAGRVAGACLLSTAATGPRAVEVGCVLADRWPLAELIGTSFEGLIADGQVWRDHPGLVLLSWSESEQSPLPFLIEADEPDLERVAEEILEAFPDAKADADALLIFFPDAETSPSIESRLPSLLDRIGPVVVAGAAAAGPPGEPAAAWASEHPAPGGCPGLYVPGAVIVDGSEEATTRNRVGVASGSRRASPWLRVTRSRPRWIDEIAGRSALSVLRDELGLSPTSGLEGLLDRLLVQFRGRDRVNEQSDGEERYIVGLDARRGAFSLPIEVEQGGEIAFAWPDATRARDALRATLDDLVPSSVQLQFACRARDGALHGDDDLEPAWIAAHAAANAPQSKVVGTVGSFQLADGGQRRVHSTVLVSLCID